MYYQRTIKSQEFRIMNKKIYIFIVLLIGSIITTIFYFIKNKRIENSYQIENNAPIEDTTTVEIIWAGDLMAHLPWTNSGLKNGKYNYDTSYTYIKDYIIKADYAIVNLETTLNGPKYSGYPTFSAPDAMAHDAYNAGFDFMALSNNHCADKGKSGIKRTRHVLDSLKIPYVGIYNDTNEYNKEYPKLIEVNGIKISILNYTYSTNGMPVFPPNYVTIIDSSSIKEGIEKAKKQKSDLIIAIMHWGEEYQNIESKRQEYFAKYMCSLGVDIIFGAHPHVVQPIKTFNNINDSGKVVPVFYSVGNFISNQRDRYKDGGIFAKVTVKKYKTNTWVDDFSYQPFWVRLNKANNSYIPLPYSWWISNQGNLKIGSADSISAATFFNDTKKIIGSDVKLEY